ALFQLVEHGDAAFEERTAVDSRLDSLGTAIDKPHAERLFKIGDHLGNRGGKHRALGLPWPCCRTEQPWRTRASPAISACAGSGSPSRFFAALGRPFQG